MAGSWIVIAPLCALALLSLIQPKSADSRMRCDIPGYILEVMEVRGAYESNGALVFTGGLKVEPELAFQMLKRELHETGTPLLQGTVDNTILFIVPGSLEHLRTRKKDRPVINILLAVLTLLTTTSMGAVIAGGDWRSGLFYSLPLLTILGLHEAGHFVAARLHKIDVTPPFFIPVPFGLGTFGAFIQLRSPAVDRKGLFDVAIAGPLAGFCAALPILLTGLAGSEIVHPSHPVTQFGTSFQEGVPISASILLSALCHIAHPGTIQFGDVVHLSPLAYAGWIGVWITALNLIPIGQLDGGHAAHGLLGGRYINLLNSLTYTILILGSLFYWPGFLTWALLVYLVAGKSVPPLNDVSPVDSKRIEIGLIALAILVLTLCPSWR